MITRWKRKSKKYDWRINDLDISINSIIHSNKPVSINGTNKIKTIWKQFQPYFSWKINADEISINDTEKNGKPLSINSL